MIYTCSYCRWRITPIFEKTGVIKYKYKQSNLEKNIK